MHERSERRRAKLAAMTLDDAAVELSNALYKASLLFEELEHAGKVDGNGHHLAQEVCSFGDNLLKSRWRQGEKA
jgi:hypothetical protein